MLSPVYKYIVSIIIILICIIVNSYPLDEWQQFALYAVVLITGFCLESAALLHKIDYFKTVQELGNDGDQAKMNGNLLTFLTKGTIMIVSVSASTIQGKNLINKELSRVMENIVQAIKLSEKKRTILSYVEPRMTSIAPNLVIIVGSLSTAKLMSMAGCLTNLSKMCPCSISLMDAHKNFFGGFSSPTAMPHAGAIFYSKIVQDCLPDLRFRVDSFHENPKNEQGKYLLTEIERRLEKLQEPPLVKAIKSLAPPVTKH